MEDDAHRRQLAFGFARFVMDIIEANIAKGGDERQLHDDLFDAALKADVQYMSGADFRVMKEMKKMLFDAAYYVAPPLKFMPPSNAAKQLPKT
jgi:hypothetical protein